jgi:zinc protease
MNWASVPRVEFTAEKLPNGLEVVLCPDRRVPLVHVSVHYRVGSSDESPGYSGLAHLFEHLMFQGSANVAKNEHGRLVDEAGGRWNASTSKDRTCYFETLPANQLELALWLEADRMASLRLTEENLENQRQTVIEEKKQSYDNRPYGLASLRFDELAYQNWAYAHPVIGAVEDLMRVTVGDLQAFHRCHYGPGNAVLTVSGSFEPRQAEELIRRHFGPVSDLVTGRGRPTLDEPEQQAERREEIVDPLAPLAAISMGYQMPPLGTPQHAALSVLALVLGEGASSRFYQRFIYDRPWITGLWIGPNRCRGPQLFRIWFQVQQGVAPHEVLAEVDREIEKAREVGVTPEELEKARNQVIHRHVSSLARVARVGEQLAQGASVQGRPDAAWEEVRQTLGVTQEDVRHAAACCLDPRRRTLMVIHPGRKS